MSLKKYLLDLTQFNMNLEEEIRKIVKAHQGQILSLVKLRLYQYGVDGSGNPILPSYAYSTIDRKKDENKITSHVTLRDTGLFYKSMYIELDSSYNVLLNSSDSKTSLLVNKYGKEILHFTIQEQRIIYGWIDDGLQNIINNLGFNSSSANTIGLGSSSQSPIDFDLFYDSQ